MLDIIDNSVFPSTKAAAQGVRLARWHARIITTLAMKFPSVPFANTQGAIGGKTVKGLGSKTYLHSTCPYPATIVRIPFAYGWGAIHKDSLGFVVVDRDVCDGCQMCMVACPYHAPRFDEETGRVAKCDGCRDRVKNGLGPICVEACPQRALGFGIYEDLVDRPSMVEQVASMPNPHITSPNYSIMPCNAAKRNANDCGVILNLLEA